ncbi:TolC family protein [Planctomycetota bacterium]
MKTTGYTLPVIALAISCLGCQGSRPVETPADLQSKLQGIETVKLETLSDAEPISVAEATEQLTAKVTETNDVGEEMPLTLEQVRAATLANNLALRVAVIDPTLANTLVDEQLAKFEAAFYGDIDYRRAEGTGTGLVTKTNTYDLGISKPLPTGGSLSIGVPFSDVDAANTDGVSEAKVSIAYFQSLLRGAGTSINTQSIRIAQLSSHIVDARTKLRAIALLARSDWYYWQVYAARKELEVRQEQYKLAANQLQHAEKMVAAGAAARIEIVRAEAGLSGRLERLINAETDLQNWERNLRRVMNRKDLPLNSTTHILPQTHPQPRGLELDEDKLISFALENRMDLIELEQQLAIDDLDIAWAKNDRLPDLGFRTQFNTRNQGDAWADSYHRFSHKAYNDLSVGLSADIPLGNRAAGARLQRAKLTRIQDRARRDDLAQFIQQEVREAVSDLKRNWRRILAAEQGIIAADRDYRVEQSQFQLGRRNSTDVLLAAARLGEAQLTRIQAYADYEIVQIDLARATGTLLGYGRIMVKPITLDDSQSPQPDV